MIRKPLGALAAISIAVLGFSGAALAQDHGGPRDAHHEDRHDDRHDNRNEARRGPPPRVMRQEVRHDVRQDERRDGMRGAGPEHSYYRGGRLPTYYRSNQYVVDDWRGHRLSAPPRGYHWVQTGSDYVLVAVATGIIASILLSN